MKLLLRLLKILGLENARESLHEYVVKAELHNILVRLSQEQQRPMDEVAAELISDAIAAKQYETHIWKCWRSLSPREQQVTALTCLNYTNPQIAARLGISMGTVKTHTTNAQYKFNVHSKSELRMLLSEWDMSKWEDHL